MEPERAKDTALRAHEVFGDTLKFYSRLIGDIEHAQRYVYIEMYKYADDPIGMRIRDALTRISRQGVKIRLLLDSWGSAVGLSYFSEMIAHGAEVRFFKKLRLNLDAFTKHHRRNHRKIIIIDDDITYLGSANINEYSINWRELIVRMEGSLALSFKRCFNDSWKIYNKVVFKIKTQIRPVNKEDFRIIREVPSITKQRIKRKFENLIKSSLREIIIETPYFLPGYLLRKMLIDAARRGVNVTIIMPRQSDVGLVDVLRSKYLGMYHKSGINLRFYKPNNLHAKLMLVDGVVFCFGSPNFDYRSFRYMFEILLSGTHPSLYESLYVHVNETLEECVPFDYAKWKRRPFIHKFFEQFLIPFRHLL